MMAGLEITAWPRWSLRAEHPFAEVNNASTVGNQGELKLGGELRNRPETGVFPDSFCPIFGRIPHNHNAGKHSELLETAGLSRMTDAEMKKLMIGASSKLAELLAMKENQPEEYWRQLKFFNRHYCSHWEK